MAQKPKGEEIAAMMGGPIGLDLKAKVAIISPDGKVVSLRRSQDEDTRKGEWDWPGGSFDEDETAIHDVLHREVHLEELPGTQLHDVRPLHVRSKITEVGFKVSLLLAARATPPEGGFVLSGEHSDIGLVDPDDYPDLLIPKKYRTAVAAGAPLFQELVELYQGEAWPPDAVPELVAPGAAAA